MCSHTCLRGQACHPLTQTRWEIGLGAFLSQAFSIIGRGWWIGEMGCSITAYLRSPAAWYMWVVLSHWCLGPPHPQRLWTQRSQTFQPPYLLFQSSILIRIHFPHKTIWTQLVWHFKNSLSPSQSLILFFPLLLSPVNPSKWNTHYSSSVQITEFWESTMKLLTPLGFYCYYTIIQLWLLPNRFIHSTSQPVTTKLSPIHYLSTRVRHCTPVKKT